MSSELKNGRLLLKDKFHEQYVKNFNDLEPYQVPYFRAVIGDPSDNLKIIRPRFPSKVAYYFAKNYIKLEFLTSRIYKPETKPDDLTDKQYECLLEIYSSDLFMDNLLLMKLKYVDEIPIINKDKSSSDVLDVLNHFELNQYIKWMNSLY